ncbi:TIGR02996 domain-containing protein [Fimbriiglobus ruber]|uniref:Repeat-companion domain TIGR02996 n=1 Tax=Fimbriiglobus ruber TaxID=1908690 RepID=A0A225DLM2_9BACT|nr:TIGR02996 domain-containing protein [Fimbriiglobus ruber]OWK42282.1 hypothetical protein FRUB_04360 [Fimbriiglobus ruber]
MTHDERALLTAVAAAPDDDLPRLVYADWLEEHERTVRAEFIRLQCEIARLEVGPRTIVDQNVALWKRQQELLDGHREELLGPLGGLSIQPRDAEFRRGFLSELTLHVERFLFHDARVAAIRPLPHVRITHAAAQLASFLSSPHLGCISAIKAYDDALENSIGFLAELTLADVAGAARDLTRLTALDLEGCGIGDLGAEWLFAPDYFPALNNLDLE